MIAFDEALGLVSGLARPVGSEVASLDGAGGRVLAAPVIARVDSPPADCSAMDGYAVREADLPGALRIIGESFAGHGFRAKIEPGCAVRVFTGAPLPVGADRVVIQEEVVRQGDCALMQAAQGPTHVRRAGSDFSAGDELLRAGHLLTPRALVVVAAANWAEVTVWRRPKLVILATGDELAPPGEAHRREGSIPDSISFGISALAAQQGAEVGTTCRLRDELSAMEHAAAEALESADVVVVTGGASVGEKDFAKAMFEPHGLEMVFSKVAIKPGKPVWLGQARDRIVVGLPGNPTSAMVTARLLLAPLLAGMSGRGPTLEWKSLPLVEPLPGCGDRETFLRAHRTPNGAVPITNQESGAQRALAHADLLLRCRPRDPARAAGELVEALAF